MDHQAAVGGFLGVVAVGPDAGEGLEVGGLEPGPVRVVPEADRHRGEVAGADQFALLAEHPLAVLVPHLHVHSQPLALQLAAPHRQYRVAQGEAGDDVGAAGDGGEAELALDVAVDVLEALVGQRRAGGQHGFQALQPMALARPGAGLFQGGQVLGAGAEDADAFSIDQVHQAFRSRMEGGAVIEHQGGAQGQPGYQPVPHHPAAGGEVEQGVRGGKVAVQPVLLGMLQQGAPHPVDNALGHAGSAAGVEDVQRLVEGDRGEGRLAARVVEVVPEVDSGTGYEVRHAGVATGAGHYQQLLQRRHAPEDFIELGGQVQVLAGIAVAGCGDQHLGLDLSEAVDHSLGAEVRRTGRPGGAQAGGCEHAGHRLPGIGHEGRDPVANANPCRPQALLQAGDMGGQLGIAELLAAAILAYGHQGWMVVAAA
ncbi:hypothetical protein D3C84_369500 [compost metagenome]